MLTTHPYDDDKLREECGVFGIAGSDSAAAVTALGLHALQHRGQEAAGIVSFDGADFHARRAMGHVAGNFDSEDVIETLGGDNAVGHVRYSTTGASALRNVQPLFADLSSGGFAIAHNGNISNALTLRKALVRRGSIFQSTSDTEVIIHLVATSSYRTLLDRFIDALRQVEGAYSLICLTSEGMIACRDPLGVRPLVMGKLGDAWLFASETVAFDVVGAEFVRAVEPGELVIVQNGEVRSIRPLPVARPRPCIFEHVYFSRPDSILGGRSVYETRRQIGVELAREAPVDADLVCPVPDSGTPAAIGYSQESGIPYAMGIIRNQYMGRTFIEPSESIRNMGVRLKLNVNRALIKGKRVILVDDSVVRGTTSRKIKDMILEAGAAEVHFRIASPPTAWPCFYDVDTPERSKLLAATMTEDEMRDWIGVDSLKFITLDGLYRAAGEAGGRDAKAPKYCDACFSGEYPIVPSDKIEEGFQMKAAE